MKYMPDIFQILNKNSCMEVPKKKDNVQRKEHGFYGPNTDQTEKNSLKKQSLPFVRSYHQPVER